jgi:hypothetical protein
MATYSTNVLHFAENLRDLALTIEVGALIAVVIQDWIDENEDYWELELSTEDHNALLKELTGNVVGTGTNLSCYPLGVVTAILFDVDGNPVT